MKLTQRNKKLIVSSYIVANELIKYGYQMKIKKYPANRRRYIYVFKVENLQKMMDDVDSIYTRLYS